MEYCNSVPVTEAVGREHIVTWLLILMCLLEEETKLITYVKSGIFFLFIFLFLSKYECNRVLKIYLKKMILIKLCNIHWLAARHM